MEASDGRWVYRFADGSADMRELLGGKGANLAEMTNLLGADAVPGGFIITTAACVEHMRTGEFPDGLAEQVDTALAELEEQVGKRFDSEDDPLLVSVRSGAPISMPGMLDTILNLGLSDESVQGLAARSADERFAWDSYRRLVQMFGDVVRGVPGERFEQVLTSTREANGVADDSKLDAEAMRGLTAEFKQIYAEETGEEFPSDPRRQLREAIGAVFDSWRNERAFTYRRLNAIPDDLGTAVNVQRMVFGNHGPNSGSGVAFSRDPATGEAKPSGDFLLNAQGEDVVAGTRTPEDLEGLAEKMPEVHAQFLAALETLERHYRDIQDVEYTVEDGRLYILQTRSAKRSAQAGVRFAHDAVEEGLLDRDAALETIAPGSLDALLHPTFDPSEQYSELLRAVPASPGAARGAIVLSAPEAEAAAAEGRDVILVRPFTSADDVGGFHAARGILTSTGGKSSHAAIVARGMGRPCVCGASDLEIDEEAGTIRIGDTELRRGDVIAIDGTRGTVTADEVELIDPTFSDEFAEVLGWADEARRLDVRANADTPEDAARARELGASGIGLCRTEHMFFGGDREELVREMFISGEQWRRASEQDGTASAAEEAFSDALRRLGELQRGDFAEIFRVMAGLPVTIRLLDPPMHEFLSVPAFEEEVEKAEQGGDEAAAESARERLAVVRELKETNPMLGTRGARLGLLLPPLYEMQVRAIVGAALEVAAGGEAPKVEIMVPLVAFDHELRSLRGLIERAAATTMEAAGREVDYGIGTMIELPRACLRAGTIAEHADFFSFGTNDLTQTTLGLSRDDAEGSFLPVYLRQGLIQRSPFETIDTEGVGELVRIAVERGRADRPDLLVGICGEHGGDPDSIAFFDGIGLDYVSCSPFRVPIARMAAAQATIGGRAKALA